MSMHTLLDRLTCENPKGACIDFPDEDSCTICEAKSSWGYAKDSRETLRLKLRDSEIKALQGALVSWALTMGGWKCMPMGYGWCWTRGDIGFYVQHLSLIPTDALTPAVVDAFLDTPGCPSSLISRWESLSKT